ncbi:MAG: leucine-rich repeat protein, partial [Clostridia bacterium]
MKKRLGAMVCVLVLLSMLTVFAVACNKDGFKINFYDGDSIVTSISTKGKEAITLPTDPVKAGYTFEGWFFEKEFTNQLLSNTYEKTKLKEEVNVYAKWTALDNTVAFNANGGTGEMASIVAKTDAVVKLTANAFAKEGYTFAGWATTATGEVAYADGVDFKMTASGTTLYAVWTAFTYTVNFNYDGADSDTSVTTMQTTYGAAFNCPVPTKTGYVFQGWYYKTTQITDNLGACIVTLTGENGRVFDSTAKWSASTEGMTFTNDGTSATLTKYTGTAQYVVIPETYNNYPVTAIGESAFREIYSIKSVTLPSSLITIGNYAFFQCYSLEKVVYDDVSHLTTIGDRAFKGNGRLTEFTIPATLTDIGGVVGYNAFVDAGIQKFIIENGNTTFRVENNCLIKDNMVVATCGRLENMIVPSGVTSLGFDAFPQNLKSVIIPASVTELGERAFTEKYYLTSVTFESGSMLTTIGRQAFYRCALVDFTIPANVTSIKDSTFAGCSVLSSIIIPNKVTSIGMEAFYDCRGLTSITIGSGVTSIGEYAFADCSGLTSITIPDSVTSIGDEAFYGCSGLTSMTLPFVGN